MFPILDYKKIEAEARWSGHRPLTTTVLVEGGPAMAGSSITSQGMSNQHGRSKNLAKKYRLIGFIRDSLLEISNKDEKIAIEKLRKIVKNDNINCFHDIECLDVGIIRKTLDMVDDMVNNWHEEKAWEEEDKKIDEYIKKLYKERDGQDKKDEDEKDAYFLDMDYNKQKQNDNDIYILFRRKMLKKSRVNAIRSYNWRRRVLRRDGKCYFCNTTIDKRLDAHHIRRKKLYPKMRYLISNGMSLCRRCHNRIRNREEMYAPLLENAIRSHNNIRFYLEPGIKLEDIHESFVVWTPDAERRRIAVSRKRPAINAREGGATASEFSPVTPQMVDS